ncbi:MAG: cytochrome c [Bacteroidetes bacterium]|nr:cytochrome c [Bacteroidota bacterium]
MRNSIYGLLTGCAVVMAFASCTSRGNSPGWEYAPDMYYSKGYEAYSQGDSNKINPYGMTMREPVEGTIAIGKEDYFYPFPNTAEGYEAAKALNYPESFEDKDGRGKYLYGIYCSPCHGETGGNDGTVFGPNRLGKPAWKNYQDAYIQNLSVGQIYHTITYGKNNMGSHASVLSPMDRWRVIHYVKELSGAASNTTAAPADSAAMNAVPNNNK